MATKYRIKAGYTNRKTMITLIGPGEAVNLMGDPVKKIVPAEGVKTSYETEIRGATQDDLAKLFKEGNPLIEEYEDNTKGKTLDPANTGNTNKPV